MPKHWFPLESNPEVMNAYIGKMGVDTSKYAFHDVFSTEEWALSMVPRPVLGVVMLFPIKESTRILDEQENARIESEGQTVSPEIYFMKQTIGNACGTVGILHTLANSRASLELREDCYVSNLLRETATMTPAERADYLEADEAIEEAHVEAAQAGQSGQEDDVNTHFICLTQVDGCLYELDGRKNFPVNHGPSSPDTLLEDACSVVKKFMERDPGELKFTIVALCKTADS